MYQIALILLIIIFIKLYKKQEYFSNPKLHGSFYINLDRQVDRKKYMEKQFENNHVKCKRFSAFDKKILSKEKILEMKNNSIIDKKHNVSKNKLGTIACLVSHTELYKKIKKEYNGGTFLIFEDDCKILPNFNKKLNNVLNNLPEDWDMIWLGYNKIKGYKYNELFYKPYAGKHYGYNSQHHCYLLNYKFIPKLLNILLPVKQDFNTKDTVLRVHFDDFNPYFLNERLAVQDQEEFPTSERTGGRNG
tara:strand:- start:127 stop:867 length:741 start_codon:yes stop_codon:yes gene_type:complete